MLAPSDAGLVARDPGLPGLRALLDDQLLRELLGVPVSRRYLRYKPGTSCVLGAVLERPTGPADLFVTAYARAGAAKLVKTAEAAPAGSVLFSDRATGLLAVLASADRDLPFLGVLADDRLLRRTLRELLPGTGRWRDAQVRTLSYKPQRRWVGSVSSARGRRVVLRAYRPADARAAEHAVRVLTELPPRTPRLLAADIGLGLLVLEYVDGRTLDAGRCAPGTQPAPLPEVGAALARLHGRPLAGLPERSAAEDAEALHAAAAQVSVLLPELAPSALRLAAELSRRLGTLPRQRTVIHGDFSTDQVLVGPDRSVTLLDLDRATEGDPAADLGSLAAALTAGEVLGAAGAGVSTLSQVRTGYAAVRALPPQEAVGVHAAALLLRRAVEPFRLCLADWPERVAAMLRAATEATQDGGPLSLDADDLVAPILGSPLSWEVLKDKPGRRRTSRASGPRGTAIVKVYASGRAAVVAARVEALRDGPAEPVLPEVLLCHERRHTIVLSEVPGRTLRDALLAGDLEAAGRVGRALAGWHAAFRGRVPAALRPHTCEREVEILLRRCASADRGLAEAVRRAVPALAGAWATDTVVHRDLYEDQVVLGAGVGLVDLDDAACGPAELDLGNLLAHLSLLGRRTGHALETETGALLAAYEDVAPIDSALLHRCRALSLLRLACVHRDPELVAVVEAGSPASTRAM